MNEELDYKTTIEVLKRKVTRQNHEIELLHERLTRITDVLMQVRGLISDWHQEK